MCAGAQPDVTSVAGQTPLHHAAERNRVKSVDALLLHEASLSAVDAAGSTPLHLAAFHGAVVSAYIRQRIENIEKIFSSIGRVTSIVSSWCASRCWSYATIQTSTGAIASHVS